jgi:hypothetical protein
MSISMSSVGYVEGQGSYPIDIARLVAEQAVLVSAGKA